ncbi:MAG TPA: PEP-CTERM sorting domain-containing protein [Bryobacteraceae bacterium]|nr:PEP-CTERM sorting domain-containing protein [Bryobacteraceae bacterium]
MTLCKLTVPLVFLFTGVGFTAPVYVISAGITGNGVFGTVDLATGMYNPIGPTEPDGYFGMATGPNGALYSLNYSGQLDQINPITGAFTRIGATGLQPCLVPSPACGPTSVFGLGGIDGKLFATDFSNSVYSVNPATGAATLLAKDSGLPAAPFVPGSQNPDGTFNLADTAIWGAAGKLYATYDAFVFDFATSTVESIPVAPKLYTIDPTTGLATVIGATDLGIGAATEVNGITYAFNDLTTQIATVNLLTGGTTGIGTFDPAAEVLQGAAPVTPEPGSVGLAALGLAALLFFARRKRDMESRESH